MKLYYYLLYKIFRFRKLIHVRSLESRSEIPVDAAGLLIIPMLGWSLLGVGAGLHVLKTLGLVATKASHQFCFMLLLGGQWGAVWWGNYRLLRGPRWRSYATEFSSYDTSKRLLGSLLAFITLVALTISPFFLLKRLQP
ncbi:hypothetical protein KB206_12905 [Microvirga sp. STS02]|uniref:hypothetical protein n=1 Tax=Hymenobacter negativus TaxID=2795026 RepID=UPI0018DE8AE9|nr:MULTISPECIES: hypothetical protein [Bacteria]MBH8569785.1 hypothetical protein [Hymenobacter negativus]MBR7209525.1 hypothetical protein [Microvirga sp. STS02]